MRLLANVILTISLTVGAIAAASAYLAPLSLPADRLEGLTLNAPAGVAVDDTGAIVRGDDGVPQPMFSRDHELSLADAEALKAQADLEVVVDGRSRTVSRILVKEFSFARWEGRWFFLLALAGLGVGAFLVKSATRAEIASAEAARADGETPEEALEAIASTIAGLMRDLPSLPDDRARCEAIVEMLGRVQRDQVPVFVDARTLLISRLTLAGYAALMDRFAAMERQINRAWSAAADEHYPEASACIEKANLIVGETRERLNA
ncbi:MAG: hypothetical protein ACF8QF_09365 [Phycisphaerales bacterium]